MCAALRCHALHYAAMRCTAVQVPRAALHCTQCAALHCTCTPPHHVAHATLDRCIDPAAVCSHPPSWSPLLMGAWTPGIERLSQSAAAPLFAQQTNNCKKLCRMGVAVTSVRRWTDCTGSLIRARLARAGYRFACFLDAQGTPSLRIRVGQRGQGTRRSAARRGFVVEAISISQNHMRLVAR